MTDSGRGVLGSFHISLRGAAAHVLMGMSREHSRRAGAVRFKNALFAIDSEVGAIKLHQWLLTPLLGFFLAAPEGHPLSNHHQHEPYR